ncbi:hypothetical protein ACFYUL_17865 [Streptomyces sp. NPDC004311]|uniref:hypothetical protein n=1 Tax=Streptomyces sp. NPDC004311 TaxID=3364698 RepID=UPI0036A9E0D5
MGRSAKREYWADVAGEPPPEWPAAPWTPEPPGWMVKPVPVYDVREVPVEWVDEAPYQEWAGRVGKARFELMKLDAAAAREEALPRGGVPPGMPFQPSRRLPLEWLNHPSQRLTVQERQQYGATAPWTSRKWVQENEAKRKKAGGPTVYLPPPEDDGLAEGWQDITCTVAPWWLED